MIGNVGTMVNGLGFRNSETAPMAASRATDPDASHVAAATVEMDGTANCQRTIVLSAVRLRPGSTAAEIARDVTERGIPMDSYQANRRLPELRKIGKIKNGDDRVCSVKNSTCSTWWTVVSHG